MKSSKLSSSFRFKRHDLELVYSIFILIIIPILLVANTLLFVQSARSDFDTELRQKADLANEIFGTAIINRLDDREEIQRAVDKIVANRPEVVSIDITTPESGSYQVVASSDLNSIGTNVDDLQYHIVNEKEQSVAQLVDTEEYGRVWSIVTPVFNNEGELVATTSIDLSLSDADQLIGASLQKSFIVLMVTIVIVVLLLWNHFRFVEYAQLYKKLQEADQLKNDFLSVATHELKAPMTTIKGYTSNVIDGTLGEINDSIKDSLSVVVSQTERLNNLVQDLLNISRIEQGKISFDIQPHAASEVIERVLKMYEDKAKEKDIKLEFNKPSDEPNIKVDINRLEEIITNLVDNAVKYSIQGSVTVGQKANDKFMTITIKDTGIGMSPEESERLFQRFYRVRNDKTKEISGTGLGLWIIKQYIEKMGGKISVSSMEDVGSQFSVELPLA